MMLSYALVLYFVGLATHVVSPVIRKGLFDDDAKVRNHPALVKEGKSDGAVGSNSFRDLFRYLLYRLRSNVDPRAWNSCSC